MVLCLFVCPIPKITHSQLLMSAPQHITIIFSPYHVGTRDSRVGNGPQHILDGGFVPALREMGYTVNLVEIERVDEFEGEIGRSFEILRRTSVAVHNAVSNGTFPLVLSGNCMATAAVACGLAQSSQVEPSFLYFDAHDDLDSPDVNWNGYLDAMGLSMLCGESWKGYMRSVPGFRPHSYDGKFLYCGLRDCTDLQRQRVRDAGMDAVWGDLNADGPIDFVGQFHKRISEHKYSPSIVHLDLDCLDPSCGQVNDFPSNGGLSAEQLKQCFEMIPEYSKPEALTICSFDPDCGDPEKNDGDKIAVIAINTALAFFRALKEGIVERSY